MPRGEHFRKVKDGEIVRQFDREVLGRRVLTPAEVAQLLNEHVLSGGETISPEAIRQRLIKLEGDRVDAVKIGEQTLFKKKDEEVFADGPSLWEDISDRFLIPGGMIYLFLANLLFGAEQVFRLGIFPDFDPTTPWLMYVGTATVVVVFVGTLILHQSVRSGRVRAAEHIYRSTGSVTTAFRRGIA